MIVKIIEYTKEFPEGRYIEIEIEEEVEEDVLLEQE